MMRDRRFGRTGWSVSEIGYGMWGMGGWTRSNDDQSLRALDHAVALGCTFFDTAWVYGEGRSEKLLGQTLRTDGNARPMVATKIPPKNMMFPVRAEYTISDTYPADHIRAYTEKSLVNLGVEASTCSSSSGTTTGRPTKDGCVKLFLKYEGLVRAFGISVNWWEPTRPALPELAL
jgi:aryl-alcohol dehydrogenase-like predicted oxidoreductase